MDNTIQDYHLLEEKKSTTKICDAVLFERKDEAEEVKEEAIGKDGVILRLDINTEVDN